MSNSEPLAYAAWRPFLSASSPAFLKSLAFHRWQHRQHSVFHVPPKMITVFNKQDKRWGTKAPHYPTTPSMSSLHQCFWAISLQELEWGQGMRTGQETQGSTF